MSIQTLRSTLALALAGGLLGLSPAAAAQALVPLTGDPISYQVSVPEGWETEQDEDMLYVTGDDVIVLVGASDLMADEENPLPVSEAEARRIFTNMIVDSDSMLLGMMQQGFAEGMGAAVTDAVQEIRSLGGVRAAYMRGRVEADGERGWVDVHLTMKDGIMYLLAFMVRGDEIAPHAPLMARIHESFVLADGPPASAP